jgi:hypothetical protein
MTFVFKCLANSTFNLEKRHDITGLLNLKTQNCVQRSSDLTVTWIFSHLDLNMTKTMDKHEKRLGILT